jgi:hypothetical protein
LGATYICFSDKSVLPKDRQGSIDKQIWALVGALTTCSQALQTKIVLSGRLTAGNLTAATTAWKESM